MDPDARWTVGDKVAVKLGGALSDERDHATQRQVDDLATDYTELAETLRER